MTSYRRPLALAALLLSHFAATAQRTLTLTVLERGAERPVVGANVVYAADQGLSLERGLAVADADGLAKLTLPGGGAAFFSVSSVGFVTVSGWLGAAAADTVVYMEEDVVGLSGVVVTGSRAARPLKLSPVQTQVLGGGALVEAGYGNLQQALRQETPGLNIQKVGFGNEISMQGLDARHVLFLLDGERMTGEMAGNLDYERFNLHAIDRVEVVKGASSTLYGSRASGAVINLITKKTARPADVRAGARWAQRSQRNVPGARPADFLYMFEKNADRPNLQAWVSAGFRAGTRVTTQTDILYNSTDAFYLYQARGDSKLYTREANPWLAADTAVVSTAPRPPMGVEGSEYVSAQQKVYVDDLGPVSLLAYGNWFFMNTYDLIEDMTFNQSRDFTLGFKASCDVGDWLTATVSLHGDFYNRFKRHERLDTRSKVYDSQILQPRLTLTSRFFDGHDIIFGVEHSGDELTSDRFSGSASLRMRTRSLRETEWFVQDEWALSPRWTLSLGVRSNFSRAFGLMAMPKVAAKWTPAERWALRANYSMGYRAPSIKELFFNWDHMAMFTIKGNEYLKPEKNNYFSLGAEFADDRLFVSVNAYANFFRRKIEGVWRVYDMQYNFEYVNLHDQRLLGVESILRWRLPGGFTLGGTYSFVNVSKLDGVQVNTTSPHAATASLDYKLARPRYRLAATLSVSAMGGKRFDIQDRLTLGGTSREAYFRTDLPPYALCNVSVSQTLWGKVRVAVGVDNVFDYVPKTLGAGITMFNIPATPGARGHVQVELFFDEIVKAWARRGRFSD